MLYISQLLNKPLYYKGEKFAKVLDLAILENRPVPPVSKIVIRRNEKKLTISPSVVNFEKGNFTLKTQDVPFLPYDGKDFYLNEDLLDKQVIDVDGRRVVRVNDIMLESNGELKVVGIDVGFSGIVRRLGFGKLLKLKTKTLPWTLVEAFDYQTGAVRIKLTQNRLSTFHPSEIADILEEIGTKERVAIFDVLDAQKAAAAIQEADTQTQSSILESLSPVNLKNIVSKMLLSEIADVFYKINPLRIREILKSLDIEKAQKVERLSSFPDDAAGGLMELAYFQQPGEKTVKETLSAIAESETKPEAIIVTNGNEKVVGMILAKDLVNADNLALLKDIVTDRKFVSPNTGFWEILRLFTQYNLRILPVVDKEKKVLGIVNIDTVLSRIEEEKKNSEVL